MELLTLFLEIIQQHFLLIIAFFWIAILYSSVGFGGGSSYLAILSLTGIAFIEIRTISLLCNVVVVSGGTYLFAKNKLLDFKKVLPLVSLSVPMAFLGGFLKIQERFFFIFLAFALIIAAILMFVSNNLKSQKNLIKRNKTYKNAFYGGLIGFVSGIVGIGGGVFLAPLLHLTKWDRPKKIAATTSLFILVNSVAGLLGQMQNAEFRLDFYITFVLLVVVFVGGQIGSRLSVAILDPKIIKIVTALLIAFVGIKILFQ
ncbi:MAG: sulfite exporter TauE/SafE family protein [Flavobacteriaceae bacterium]|nr:sulfite exporter TauE/SafE family protein [Flavobacteriaceae bacterium]